MKRFFKKKIFNFVEKQREKVYIIYFQLSSYSSITYIITGEETFT